MNSLLKIISSYFSKSSARIEIWSMHDIEAKTGHLTRLKDKLVKKLQQEYPQNTFSPPLLTSDLTDFRLHENLTGYGYILKFNPESLDLTKLKKLCKSLEFYDEGRHADIDIYLSDGNKLTSPSETEG